MLKSEREDRPDMGRLSAPLHHSVAEIEKDESNNMARGDEISNMARGCRNNEER